MRKRRKCKKKNEIKERENEKERIFFGILPFCLFVFSFLSLYPLRYFGQFVDEEEEDLNANFNNIKNVIITSQN